MEVVLPIPVFYDLKGEPLDNGYIYIGVLNQDPVANPVNVFWDDAYTIPAEQPLRTKNGQIYYQGAPSQAFTPDVYSIKITDQRGITVLFSNNGVVADAQQILAELKTVDGSGSGLVAEGTQSVIISDMNFDPTTLGLAIREFRNYTTTNPPLNPPMTMTTGACTLTRISLTDYIFYVLITAPSLAYETRVWTGGAWGAWISLVNTLTPFTAVSSGYPYTVPGNNGTPFIYYFTGTNNPNVVNLPSAVLNPGMNVTLINGGTTLSSTVKIVPFAGQKIGALANDAPVYMRSVTYSTGLTVQPNNKVTLISNGTSWVISGNWLAMGTTSEPTSQMNSSSIIFTPPNGDVSFSGTTTNSSNMLTIGVTALNAPPVGAFTGVLANLSIRTLFSGSTTANNAQLEYTCYQSNTTTSPLLVSSNKTLYIPPNVFTNVSNLTFDMPTNYFPVGSSGNIFIRITSTTGLQSSVTATFTFSIIGFTV